MTAKKTDKPKNKGGRPPIFKTPEDLQILIDDYFEKCDRKKQPYTICGLAIILGCDRKTILNYSKNDKFFPTIKKARMKCQEYAERQLFRGSGQVAGIIFNLKNNHEWKDNVGLTDGDGGPISIVVNHVGSTRTKD